MLEIFSLVLSLAALAAAGALLVLARRAGRARQELAQRQHDAALALDRRCDALQHQLDGLARHQRIAHLRELVSVSERQGRLSGEVARRLERYLLDLDDDARRETEIGRAA